jgi:choline transport protein
MKSPRGMHSEDSEHLPLPAARWSLGKWGALINALAVVYSAFVFFWSFWPVTRVVDGESMNFAVVIFGGVIILALAMFWFKGRKVYKGPVVNVVGYHRD